MLEYEEDVSAGNNTGLWTDRSGQIELVVREGDVAPCLPGNPEATFDSFADMMIARGGTICFLAYLAGPGIDSSNDGSIWRSTPDGLLHPVMREGDSANNTLGRYSSIHSVACNDAGGLAFIARLIDPGVDPRMEYGIGAWISEAAGGAPRLAVRRGDRFDLPGGERRRIASLACDRQTNASGGSGGYGRVFNDSGQLLVRLAFSHNGGGVALVELTGDAAPGRSRTARNEAGPTTDPIRSRMKPEDGKIENDRTETLANRKKTEADRFKRQPVRVVEEFQTRKLPSKATDGRIAPKRDRGPMRSKSG